MKENYDKIIDILIDVYNKQLQLERFVESKLVTFLLFDSKIIERKEKKYE